MYSFPPPSLPPSLLPPLSSLVSPIQLQLEGKKKKKKKKPLVDLTTGEVKPASEQAPPPTVEAPPTTTISDGGQGQESGVGATVTGTGAPAVTMDDDLGESCDTHVIVLASTDASSYGRISKWYNPSTRGQW